MSEVKRFYWDTPSEYGHAEEDPEGELVWWEDYAKLEAKVERLRKAGDAMAALIKYEPGVNTFDPVPQVVKKWNAAKEGKPSV